jgi:hypothetical protein
MIDYLHCSMPETYELPKNFCEVFGNLSSQTII